MGKAKERNREENPIEDQEVKKEKLSPKTKHTLFIVLLMLVCIAIGSLLPSPKDMMSRETMALTPKQTDQIDTEPEAQADANLESDREEPKDEEAPPADTEKGAGNSSTTEAPVTNETAPTKTTEETKPQTSGSGSTKESTAVTGGGTSSGQTVTSGNTVYVTPSGKRYHKSAKCAGKNATATSLEKAKITRTPCAKCAS